MPDSAETEVMHERKRKFRPRWQRWLLWTLLRSFLIIGVGVGIGTARQHSFPSLMTHARRVAPLNGFTAYEWISEQDIMFYQKRANNVMAKFRWNIPTQSLTPELAHSTPHSGLFNGYPVGGLSFVREKEKQRWRVEMPDRTQYLPPDENGKRLLPSRLGYMRLPDQLRLSIVQFAFSPNGKQLACLGWTRRTNFQSDLLYRFWPAQEVKRKERACIYICNSDGTHLRCLGYVDAKPRRNSMYCKSGTPTPLMRLDWLSDGNYLAFPYGDGLYVLPVQQRLPH